MKTNQATTPRQFVEIIKANTNAYASGNRTLDQHFKRNSKVWDEVQRSGNRNAVNAILNADYRKRNG
jgi:hypothetical protein